MKKKINPQLAKKLLKEIESLISTHADLKGNGNKVQCTGNVEKIGIKSVERHPNSSKGLHETSCPECGGSGFWENDERGHKYEFPIKCEYCNGTGKSNECKEKY